MPYCPDCRDEFQEWVEVCPDCGVPLVDKLPELPEHKEKDEPLVYIATAPNEPVAMMWKEILENEGIYPLVKSAELQAAMYMTTLISPWQIHVIASQAKRAEEILAPFIEDDIPPFLEDDI